MPVQIKDTRRGARFAVNLTGNCFPSADEASDEKNQIIGIEGEVKDISSRGACIVTEFPLMISEVLKVAFPIQGSISNYISTPRTLAEVRWTQPAPDNKFISGFRFLL